MKKFLKVSFSALPLLLAACSDGSVQDTLGINREAPDEFTVVSRPPLSLPPEFSLRPPRSGEAPRGQSANDRARDVLNGKTTETQMQATDAPAKAAPALSEGADNLLKRAGASAADSDIRSKLTTDAATPVDTSNAKTLLDQITGAEKNEPVVDAKKEAERLRDNKDAGKPVTEGDVPEITPKPRSLIDRIF